MKPSNLRFPVGQYYSPEFSRQSANRVKMGSELLLLHCETLPPHHSSPGSTSDTTLTTHTSSTAQGVFFINEETLDQKSVGILLQQWVETGACSCRSLAGRTDQTHRFQNSLVYVATLGTGILECSLGDVGWPVTFPGGVCLWVWV